MALPAQQIIIDGTDLGELPLDERTISVRFVVGGVPIDVTVTDAALDVQVANGQMMVVQPWSTNAIRVTAAPRIDNRRR